MCRGFLKELLLVSTKRIRNGWQIAICQSQFVNFLTAHCPVKIRTPCTSAAHASPARYCLPFSRDGAVKGVFRGLLCTRWLHSHFSRGSYSSPTPVPRFRVIFIIPSSASFYSVPSRSFHPCWPRVRCFTPFLIILCKHIFLRISVSRRRRANTWAPLFTISRRGDALIITHLRN